MPEKEVISNLLKSCRREPPRKQAELAREIHISRKQVSSLELKKANPSMSILKKIAAYRGLSLAELLWTNKQSPCPPCGDLLPEQIMAVRVMRFRVKNKISQELFAERAGISVSLLSRIENSKAAPCLDVLQNLARHMDITVAELFIPFEEEDGK